MIAFGLAFHSKYLFLTAGPLCGIVGGLAYGRRWGLPLVLGTSFGLTGGLLTVQQDVRSPLFTNIVWVGLVVFVNFVQLVAVTEADEDQNSDYAKGDANQRSKLTSSALRAPYRSVAVT